MIITIIIHDHDHHHHVAQAADCSECAKESLPSRRSHRHLNVCITSNIIIFVTTFTMIIVTTTMTFVIITTIIVITITITIIILTFFFDSVCACGKWICTSEKCPQHSQNSHQQQIRFQTTIILTSIVID